MGKLNVLSIITVHEPRLLEKEKEKFYIKKKRKIIWIICMKSGSSAPYSTTEAPQLQP